MTDEPIHPDDAGAPTDDPPTWLAAIRTFASPWVVALALVATIASAVGRFFVTSPLWLDEALSANISKLPIDRIPDALRHDGHPPLYYVLLHGWMAVFGEGDHAVRALSGVISLATVPLAYLVGRRIAGRRLGVTVALIYVLLPYGFRYGSETRMYALVMAEVFAGYLLVDSALSRPKPARLAGVALVTGLLLWTHYWSLWLLAAVGIMLVVRVVGARRRGDGEESTAALATIGAMVVGGLTFVPWLPTLLYQNAHTGTPWAPSFRITTMVVTSLTEFAGGSYSEAQIGALVLALLLVIGIFGTGIDRRRIELDFHTHALARRPLVVLALTIAIASAVGMLNGMAFSARYAAVFVPFVLVLVALGIQQFRGGIVRDVLVRLVVLVFAAGTFFVVRTDRSQSREAAGAIRRAAPSGVVVTCPDQLGPSTARELDAERYPIWTYPRFAAPDRVDWVDYARRNARNDPARFATELLRRAGDRPIFLVYRDDFLTLKGQCQRVADVLSTSRPPHSLLRENGDDFYEPMTVVEFATAPAG